MSIIIRISFGGIERLSDMCPEIRNLIFTVAAVILLLTGFVWSADAFTFADTVVPVILSVIAFVLITFASVVICFWIDSRKGI